MKKIKSQQIDDVKLIVVATSDNAKNKEVIHQDNQVLDCTVIETSYETLGKKLIAIFREKIFSIKKI